MKSRFRKWGLVVAFLGGVAPVDAIAAPITVEYWSGSKQSGSPRVVGTVSEIVIPSIDTLDAPQVMGLPGFDTTLGTLLSAHLTIDAVFDSRIFDHSKGNNLIGVPAFYQHSGRATMEVVADGDLFNILQHSSTPDFGLHLFQTFNPTSEEDKVGVNAYVEVERHRSSSRSFDEVFEGAALAPFLDVISFGYFSHGQSYLSFFGEHTGHVLGNAVSGALNPPTTMSPGTKPGLGTVALLTLSMINTAAEEETGHELLYSDMHLAMAAELGMTVRYTYEPLAAPSVPEPAAVILLGTGLAGVCCRRWRRRSAASRTRR